MVPYAFGSSDGLFNLGSALSFVQVLPPGVYVAMNGQHFPWNGVRKNTATGYFELVNHYERSTSSCNRNCPSVGTTIFTVMSRLASDLGAINLVAGVSRFRLRSRAGRGGRASHARRTQPVRTDAGRAGAARGDRGEVPGFSRPPLRSGNRSHGHLGRHRGHLRCRRRGDASGRRSHRARALLRLVHPGDRVERRRSRSSCRCVIRTTASTGRPCARRSRRRPGC